MGVNNSALEKYEGNSKIRDFSKRFLSSWHLKPDVQDITSYVVAAVDK